MAIDESMPTEKSLIAWKEGQADCSLAQFLEQNAPSKTRRRPGGDGWIWVRSVRADLGDPNKKPTNESLHEAKKILDEVVRRLEDIDKNDSIPKIKSKTSGPSKKMLKDSSVQRCEEALREIGLKKWASGKWMFFEGAEYVNLVFGRLAQSIIDGPLSKLKNARCHTIKVATADSLRVDKSRPGKDSQQLICLYFDNIWSKEDATEVLKCIVKEHGQIPNSAKADLYTMINLDSNHPSKIRSTLYRPAELFTWEQIREWQTAFFEELKKNKPKDINNKSPARSSKTEAEPTGSANKKRKYGLEDGDREPVNPEQFWPSPKSDQKDASTHQRTSSRVATENRPNSSKAQPLPVDDDSETESESEPEGFKIARQKRAEEMASRTTPESKKDVNHAGKLTMSGAEKPPSHTSPGREKNDTNAGTQSSTPIRASETELRRKDYSPKVSPIRAPEAQHSNPPKPKPKETPIVVLKVNRKRDRFGRDDF
ncbi:uncharacterized protein FA14DRAFT_40335 [Meira miltonrushii]|uniref:Uncharacterized protein n=1 Tax=Meira miltonrushii TaxID=1280837 RepID=A0A316VCQ8_9BASI|nr:uncharacterized protein FA14DRAFT_40335 [Meira miltonrushii]PWN35342.1 hypothetical protein FA14DRAFT_40335 [Meira miltonrushii]